MKKELLLPSGEVIEALTRRERDVLALLGEDLSNQEIAQRLIITAGSLKWYTKQIYAKLGVGNRRQAVHRARELSLLPHEMQSVAAKPQGNLPAALTPFIGREIELETLRDLLSRPAARLVTLTGAGGVGKTRLALRAAEFAQTRYPDGTWLVDFSPLNAGQDLDLAQTIAAVLGLPLEKNRTPREALLQALHARQALLLLDNCEHLVDACAQLVETLLWSCPRLRILVTSREALGLGGEICFQVPPLALPHLGETQPLQDFTRCAAVSLFVERARSVRPEFAPSPANRAALACICHKLDGIPLALELAAARLNVLEPEQIASRLEQDFQVLASGGRTAPSRQKTMRASLEWSYQLLSAQERMLLQRLSVFAGGWTLDLIEVPGENTLDLFTQLINKSLLVKMAIPDAQSGPRYRMLEPILQFAREKLTESRGETRARGLHLDSFLTLAEKAEASLRGKEQKLWLERFEFELNNLRLALEWGLKTDPLKELRLATALLWFWHIRGHWAEGLDWLQKGLEAWRLARLAVPAGKENELIRAKALSACGYLRRSRLSENYKEFEQAIALFNQSLDIFRKLGPERRQGMAFALLNLSGCAVRYLSNSQVLAWANQSLALYQEIDDDFGRSECLALLAANERNLGRSKEAYEQVLLLKERLGDADGYAFVLGSSSLPPILEGDYPQAEARMQKSLDLLRSIGNLPSEARSLKHLAWIQWLQGKTEDAQEHIEEAIALSRESKDLVSLSEYHLQAAWISLSQGRLEEARLLAADALHSAENAMSTDLHAAALAFWSRLALLEGNLDAARRYVQKSLGLSRPIQAQIHIAEGLHCLGRIHCLEGNRAEGERWLKDSVRAYARSRFSYTWLYVAYPLEALAQVALEANERERARDLLHASELIFPGLEQTLSPLEKEERQTLKMTCRSEDKPVTPSRANLLMDENSLLDLLKSG